MATKNILNDADTRTHMLRSIEASLVYEQKRLERLILATPTGPTREAQTVANIHMMAAVEALEKS